MFKKNLSIFGFSAILAVVGVLPVVAQTTASLSGTVADSTGAIIPGVAVSVVQVETGAARSVVTDDQGRYQAPSLQPGTYEVSAELPGFQTAVRSGLTLSVGDRSTVDLTLTVGEISERVVVEGEAALVDTTDTTLAGLVDDKKIRDLPLNGRSFDQLALLQPGVAVYHHHTGTSNVGTGTHFSVAGSRPAHNSFILDGININDAASQTPGSAAGNNLGVEAIREFKVLTNTYSAAYGRSSGAIVTVVTKSGTNQWHGSVFEFHRNSALDAKNFFDQVDRDIAPFKRNQFGFSIGGPIVEDKTFIFGTYEGLREGLAVSNVGIVINEAARNGTLPDLANPGETIDIEVADSAAVFFPFIPIPNGRDFGDGTAEFVSSPNRTTHEDYFSVRLDHTFSENNSLFSRYTIDDGEVLSPDKILLYESASENRHQSFVLEERAIISPSFINTARLGFSRSFFQLESVCLNSCPATFIPGKQFGKFRFGQAQSGPAPITTIGTANPELAPYTTFQFADDINLTRGAHAIQAGINVTRIHNNQVINGTGSNGQFVFDTIEQFLMGAPASFNADTIDSNRHRGVRHTLFGFYIQDEFRYSPNLTLNLGLRWEFTGQPGDPAYTACRFSFTGSNGQFEFDTIEQFLMGAPASFNADTIDSNRHRGVRHTLFGFYIQDEFRYSPNLTLNLGLRWEFVTEVSEAAGRSAQLVNLSDPAYTEGLPLFNFTPARGQGPGEAGSRGPDPETPLPGSAAASPTVLPPRCGQAGSHSSHRSSRRLTGSQRRM